jgi:hypothetical protein
MPIGLQVDKLIMDSIFQAIMDYTVELGYTVDTSAFPDDPTKDDVLEYQSQIQAIKTIKGYDIKVFGESSARYKGRETAPRIVIFQSRVLPGDIGAPVHTIITQDADDASKYAQGFLPPQAQVIIAAIHLISANSTQLYLLNQILGKVIGQRRYLPFKSGGGRFFIEQTSFGDLDDPIEQIMEKVYFFTIPDIYIGDIDIVRATITPIAEIKVKTQIGQLPPNTSDEIVVS